MRQRTILQSLALAGGVLLATQVAATPVAESEANDTFSSAQTVDLGALATSSVTVSAELLQDWSYPAEPSLTGASTLTDGGVVSFVSGSNLNPPSGPLPPLAVGTPYVALVDNSASGVDTTLGVFNPDDSTQTDDPGTGTPIVNDDGSPLGDGFGSAVRGFVDAAGEIHLKVSGYGDENFDGLDDFDPAFTHGQSGDFTLNVYIGFDRVQDVDFYTFLAAPGAAFTADLTSVDNIDSVLGWFDDGGNLIGYNDDKPGSFQSALSGVVPGSGKVTLAVSGFNDQQFYGAHFEAGAYDLAFSTSAPVPAPATLALLGLGLAGLGAAGRRRRC